MTSATSTSLLGYMLVCSFTPGPGNKLALNTTSTYGWKRSRSLILDDPRTSASKKMRPRSNPKRNTQGSTTASLSVTKKRWIG